MIGRDAAGKLDCLRLLLLYFPLNAEEVMVDRINHTGQEWFTAPLDPRALGLEDKLDTLMGTLSSGHGYLGMP